MKQYKFILVDFYENNIEIIAASATRGELRKEYSNWWDETDGECDLKGYDISTKSKRKECKKELQYFKRLWN